MRMLAEGFLKAIPKINETIPKILTAVVNGIKSGFEKVKDIGKNLIKRTMGRY